MLPVTRQPLPAHRMRPRRHCALARADKANKKPPPPPSSCRTLLSRRHLVVLPRCAKFIELAEVPVQPTHRLPRLLCEIVDFLKNTVLVLPLAECTGQRWFPSSVGETRLQETRMRKQHWSFFSERSWWPFSSFICLSSPLIIGAVTRIANMASRRSGYGDTPTGSRLTATKPKPTARASTSSPAKTPVSAPRYSPS